MQKFDEFTAAYIECAIWSSLDDAGKPLDANYGISDIAPETLDRMVADCAKFQHENAEMIGGRDILAGHDFWLTRNRHGAGFWDGDWPEHGDRLTLAAHAFIELALYIGDDGKLYT